MRGFMHRSRPIKPRPLRRGATVGGVCVGGVCVCSDLPLQEKLSLHYPLHAKMLADSIWG